MKNRKSLKVGILFLILSGFLAAGCGANGKSEEKPVAKTPKVDSVSIMVAKVEAQPLAITKSYAGSIEGEQQANLISQMSLRIMSIPVKVGDQVRAGQVLIGLDKSGSSSQYFQAQSNLKNTEKNYERTKSLFEGGAVSRQALDQMQMAYEVAKANFDAARNAVEITTPISGVVTMVKQNVGDFTAPGQPIITVAKVSSLKIIMSVGEGDIPYIKTGQKVKVYSELNADIFANGKVTEINRSADLQTRTFEVKAVFPNAKDQWFKPGMFAKAEIELNSTGKAVPVIPREAVIYSQDGAKIFVINDGKSYSRTVKLGLQNDNLIEVVDGLKQGDTVATVGLNNLKDGQPVIISNNSLLSIK